jgi:pimeloyl-ACP methyl ester carboxylesterase
MEERGVHHAVGTRVLTVQRIRSPLIECGDPFAEEATVFVHGNPGSSEDWRELISRVGPFGRAIALDMPGFGRADKPRHFDYTVPGYARHLGRALDALRIRRAHLVLHGFGGVLGLAWASTEPERLGSLTLIDAGVLPKYRWHYLLRIWRTRWLGELFMMTAARIGFRLLLRHGNPRGLPAPFVRRMSEDFDRDTRRAVLKLYRATNEPEALAGLVSRAFGSASLATLVIWGAHDPYLPVRYAECQRGVFPHARVVTLPDSGHWPFIDNPEAVTQVLIPFLEENIREPQRERAAS